MIRRPPRSTRTDTLFPYTTLFRSEINRIEAESDALIERIKSEGANSPADVFITVDAGRLWRAEEAGLFQPVESEVLTKAIPENLRHPEGLWFGFSTRARLLSYHKTRSAERRVGKECHSTGRIRGSP